MCSRGRRASFGQWESTQASKGLSMVSPLVSAQLASAHVDQAWSYLLWDNTMTRTVFDPVFIIIGFALCDGECFFFLFLL